jgi:Protein of unknown function (DUF3618)
MTPVSTDLSSQHHQHEAAEARRRLAGLLDELDDRLTPGQVLDEGLAYAKGAGGTLVRALANAARANPVSALMIGAGLILLLSEKMGLQRFLSLGRETAAAGSPRSISRPTAKPLSAPSSADIGPADAAATARSTGGYASEQAYSAAGSKEAEAVSR